MTACTQKWWVSSSLDPLPGDNFITKRSCTWVMSFNFAGMSSL